MKGRRAHRTGRRLTVTLSPNRQVVIPKQLCEALDLRAGEALQIVLELLVLTLTRGAP
jgi:AbrB family looped-hinge helix DNA binding protein